MGYLMKAKIYCANCMHILREFLAVSLFFISLEEWSHNYATCPQCKSNDTMLIVERMDKEPY